MSANETTLNPSHSFIVILPFETWIFITEFTFQSNTVNKTKRILSGRAIDYLNNLLKERRNEQFKRRQYKTLIFSL